MTTSCRICGGAPRASYVVHERMLQLGHPFDYFECAACGCLQIERVPADLSVYYPSAYYSLGTLWRGGRRPSLRRRLVYGWAYDRRGGPLAALLHARKPHADLQRFRALGVRREDRILDVGSGKGQRVLELQQAGFLGAEGLDPHLAEDVIVDGRLVSRRGTLADAGGTYRVVMLNHSLEHMPDQHGTMGQVRRILAPDGLAIVRIPTVSSEAWQTYREEWVQLDAPRHLYLHSRESFAKLAGMHGFRVASMGDDSTAFQYWASESNRRGLPFAGLGGDTAFGRRAYSHRELAEYERRARAANATGRGDQFVAVLVTN
jgi:SAM-dependent methyltransferase